MSLGGSMSMRDPRRGTKKCLHFGVPRLRDRFAAAEALPAF